MYNISTETLTVLAPNLPKPQGYKVLIAVAKIEEKKGSIVLPDRYQDLENTATILGVVFDMGAEAYADPVKFRSGPYCKVGDWVMFKAYSGTRFKVKDQEFRLINDDQVEARVDDPSIIDRI